jgi:hypothetical protein
MCVVCCAFEKILDTRYHKYARVGRTEQNNLGN